MPKCRINLVCHMTRASKNILGLSSKQDMAQDFGKLSPLQFDMGISGQNLIKQFGQGLTIHSPAKHKTNTIQSMMSDIPPPLRP